jgi:hypothetical protein
MGSKLLAFLELEGNDCTGRAIDDAAAPRSLFAALKVVWNRPLAAMMGLVAGLSPANWKGLLLSAHPWPLVGGPGTPC